MKTFRGQKPESKYIRYWVGAGWKGWGKGGLVGRKGKHSKTDGSYEESPPQPRRGGDTSYEQSWGGDTSYEQSWGGDSSHEPLSCSDAR